MNSRKKVTPITIFNFLLGRSDAIRAIASTKHILLLSLLFIISSGLARNYDHHLLLKEPKWILGPFFMAFFNSLVIFLYLKTLIRLPTPNSPFHNYLAFLRCFLMTAPLALLYAIPIEHLTTPLPAAQFNFLLLIIVSIWRVTLMVRTLQSLFKTSILTSLQLVLIPTTLEMFIATLAKSFDVVSLMAGNYQTAPERFLTFASQLVSTISIVLFGVFLLSLAFNHGPFFRRTKVHTAANINHQSQIHLTSWILAATILTTLCAFSLRPQEQLRNKHDLKELLTKGAYHEASVFLSTKSASSFPPHHALSEKPTHLFTAPDALLILAQDIVWPDWFRQHLEDEVVQWYEKAAPFLRRQSQRNSIYQDFPSHLNLQEFSDQYTPGIRVPSPPIEGDPKELENGSSATSREAMPRTQNSMTPEF